ncbi:hypothetical protein INR49_006890 [Caranx melampygus]|nr:hypothetical protein INR49_006890 [Caranx melampygus]
MLLCLFVLSPAVSPQSKLVCSHQPIIAFVGDDVVLPCRLEPPISASGRTVVWTNLGLDPKYIHIHEEGLKYWLQHLSYKNRTQVFVEELERGNVSMKIFKVKVSDEGKYRCHIASVQEEASVHLIVGSVSSPVVQLAASNRGSMVLQCESKGWYPEPELLWLDAEGKLLSAGPTQTVRGPGDLYTVSSRVTVEKRHSNNFTCRVQQKNINQTRDTQIHITVDFIWDPHGGQYMFTGSLILLIPAVISLGIFLWCRRHKRKRSTSDKENTMEMSEHK